MQYSQLLPGLPCLTHNESSEHAQASHVLLLELVGARGSSSSVADRTRTRPCILARRLSAARDARDVSTPGRSGLMDAKLGHVSLLQDCTASAGSSQHRS